MRHALFLFIATLCFVIAFLAAVQTLLLGGQVLFGNEQLPIALGNFALAIFTFAASSDAGYALWSLSYARASERAQRLSIGIALIVAGLIGAVFSTYATEDPSWTVYLVASLLTITAGSAQCNSSLEVVFRELAR